MLMMLFFFIRGPSIVENHLTKHPNSKYDAPLVTRRFKCFNVKDYPVIESAACKVCKSHLGSQGKVVMLEDKQGDHFFHRKCI